MTRRRRTIERGENPAGRSDSAGFLLVEALATMAISAFLLFALASGVSLMLRASERTARAGQAVEDETRMMAALAREIEDIVPLRWAGAGAGFVFSGSDRSLLFARMIAQADGARVGRVVMLDSIDGRLGRAEAPLAPDIRVPAELVMQDRQEMSRGRLSVRFAYFGRLAAGGETLTDNWGRADAMPVAIRVSLVDPDGMSRASLRVSLRVDAEPGCAAPGKALCSFVPRSSEGADGQSDRDAPINPDDPMGWTRYAQ